MTPRRASATLAPVDSVAELRVVEPADDGPAVRPPDDPTADHDHGRRDDDGRGHDGAGHDDRRHDDHDDAAAGADRAAAAHRARRARCASWSSATRRPGRRATGCWPGPPITPTSHSVAVAGRAGLRVHPRRLHPDRRGRRVPQRLPPAAATSGSPTPWRRCSPTPSWGWSRCATSRTACGTTPKVRSGPPTTGSWPASSPTTTRRRMRSSPPGPPTCCGCWRRSPTCRSPARRPRCSIRSATSATPRRWPRSPPATPARPPSSISPPGSPPSRRRRTGPTACTGRRRRPADRRRLPRADRHHGGGHVTDAALGHRACHRALRPAAPRALVPHRAGRASAATASPCSSTAAPRDAAPGACAPPGWPSCTPRSGSSRSSTTCAPTSATRPCGGSGSSCSASHWPFETGPDVVLSSEPYGARAGAAPGRRAGRRRRRADERADQRHHGPHRPRRAPGDAGTPGAGVGRGELGVTATASAGGRCGCTAAAPSSRPGRSPWPRRRTPSRR